MGITRWIGRLGLVLLSAGAFGAPSVPPPSSGAPPSPAPSASPTTIRAIAPPVPSPPFSPVLSYTGPVCAPNEFAGTTALTCRAPTVQAYVHQSSLQDTGTCRPLFEGGSRTPTAFECSCRTQGPVTCVLDGERMTAPRCGLGSAILERHACQFTFARIVGGVAWGPVRFPAGSAAFVRLKDLPLHEMEDSACGELNRAADGIPQRAVQLCRDTASFRMTLDPLPARFDMMGVPCCR